MNKMWFVTGASSGIGAGVVRAALQAGDRVVATARNLEKLRAATGQPANDRLAFVVLDVTSEEQAQQAYHHTQSGDPAKLGLALVQLTAMDAPPKQFFAGSDAVAGITRDLQARLAEVEAHRALSISTDGNF